jgi:hypothetical protein
MSSASTNINNASLSDIIDFINKLKTLSFRDAATLCCAKVVNIANQCIWGTCLSWKELGNILNDLNTVYKADDLGPLITAVLGMLEFYFGYKGAAASGNNFTSSLSIFWAMFGAFAGVVVGSLAGAYSGLKTINTAVKTDFWTGSSKYKASYYVGYGGNGAVAGLISWLETTWVVSYLSLSIALVAVPYYILAELGNFVNTTVATLPKADQASATYRLLGHATLMAFGSWMSAWSMNLSTERLLGWFDQQETNPNSVNSAVTNDVSLLWDFINHSIETLAYAALSWTIAGCTWGYVYYQLTDTTLKN